MTALLDHFLKIMENEPISLTLVLVIFLMLLLIYRQNKQLANGVSKENLETIVDALERDRELFRQLVAKDE